WSIRGSLWEWTDPGRRWMRCGGPHVRLECAGRRYCCCPASRTAVPKMGRDSLKSSTPEPSGTLPKHSRPPEPGRRRRHRHSGRSVPSGRPGITRRPIRRRRNGRTRQARTRRVHRRADRLRDLGRGASCAVPGSSDRRLVESRGRQGTRRRRRRRISEQCAGRRSGVRGVFPPQHGTDRTARVVRPGPVETPRRCGADHGAVGARGLRRRMV
ncbi:LOW QUALITY PROTEIN: universal stress protein, partial [Rhodococcus opacus PD630]